MESFQNPVHKGLDAAAIIVSVIGILVSLFVISGVAEAGIGVLPIIANALVIFAFICAVAYILRGSKKKAARYYKDTMGMFAIATFVKVLAVVRYIPLEDPALATLIAAQCTIAFGALCILAFCNDLGKRSSFICCIVAGVLLLSAVVYDVIVSCSAPAYTYLRCVPELLMAVVALFLISAKYQDKANRGSK